MEVTPEIEAWRKANPIRKWIDADGALKRSRLKYIRETLGVSKQAVYRWMHGINLPSSSKLIAITKIIRSSLPAYVRWWERMPGGTECVVQTPGSESTPARS